MLSKIFFFLFLLCIIIITFLFLNFYSVAVKNFTTKAQQDFKWLRKPDSGLALSVVGRSAIAHFPGSGSAVVQCWLLALSLGNHFIWEALPG